MTVYICKVRYLGSSISLNAIPNAALGAGRVAMAPDYGGSTLAMLKTSKGLSA